MHNHATSSHVSSYRLVLKKFSITKEKWGSHLESRAMCAFKTFLSSNIYLHMYTESVYSLPVYSIYSYRYHGTTLGACTPHADYCTVHCTVNWGTCTCSYSAVMDPKSIHVTHFIYRVVNRACNCVWVRCYVSC